MVDTIKGKVRILLKLEGCRPDKWTPNAEFEKHLEIFYEKLKKDMTNQGVSQKIKEKNAIMDLDIKRAIKILPETDPLKPIVSTILLLCLVTGMRAISFANIALGDFHSFRRMVENGVHYITYVLKIRVIKGDHDSDLEVRISEEVITPDTEDFTTKKLINITYWLSRYLENTYNLTFDDLKNLSDDYKIKSLFQLNEHQLYTMTTHYFNDVLGYPEGTYIIHYIYI